MYVHKCAKVSLKRGKQVSNSNIPLGKNVAIKNLDQEAYYKYFGVEEAGCISHNKMKVLQKTERVLQKDKKNIAIAVKL